MENMQPVLSMRGISKRFDQKQANTAVDFDLYKGEIVSLLGENGSGKTTLMNMLAGIYYPDEGQIFVKGSEVTISSPADAYRLGIGMVHQHFKLVDVFTAWENIVLGTGGEISPTGKSQHVGSKLDPAFVKARIKEICDKYGFDGARPCKPLPVLSMIVSSRFRSRIPRGRFGPA